MVRGWRKSEKSICIVAAAWRTISIVVVVVVIIVAFFVCVKVFLLPHCLCVIICICLAFTIGIVRRKLCLDRNESVKHLLRIKHWKPRFPTNCAPFLLVGKFMRLVVSPRSVWRMHFVLSNRDTSNMSENRWFRWQIDWDHLPIAKLNLLSFGFCDDDCYDYGFLSILLCLCPVVILIVTHFPSESDKHTWNCEKPQQEHPKVCANRVCRACVCFTNNNLFTSRICADVRCGGEAHYF